MHGLWAGVAFLEELPHGSLLTYCLMILSMITHKITVKNTGIDTSASGMVNSNEMGQPAILINEKHRCMWNKDSCWGRDGNIRRPGKGVPCKVHYCPNTLLHLPGSISCNAAAQFQRTTISDYTMIGQAVSQKIEKFDLKSPYCPEVTTFLSVEVSEHQAAVE